jgi:hypothetical protein
LNVTSVSYVVPPTYNSPKNPNDHNMVTTGAYGNAFELALDTATNSDGTTTETLTYQNYNGQTNGSFSAVSETGTGSNLAGAYQSLLSTLQANGELNSGTSSQLNGALSQLEAKSQQGSTDATVAGGELLVQAGGPINFSGISAYQNQVVDSLITNLASTLDSLA